MRGRIELAHMLLTMLVNEYMNYVIWESRSIHIISEIDL